MKLRYMATFVRTPPPRPLGQVETLESLTHWVTTFKTYFKRDDAYKVFLKQSSTWDPSLAHYGQQVETVGLKRTPADMKEDLVDLLSTLAGFLPHSYLTDKIINNTKGWKDVWDIIHEHYGVQVTGESLLDFEDCQRQSGESYRQYFERLLQHVKQHLAPPNVKVEQVATGAEKDTMTVTLMNMVALQWLRKVDPALIKIVKTEYSTEFKKNCQLAELVPRIAVNIDSLLERYSTGAATLSVGVNNMALDNNDNVDVNKIWNNYPPRQDSSKVQKLKKKRNGSQFCPGCFYLSQQLGATIHVKHLPADCPRKSVTINMLQMEDTEQLNTEGKYSAPNKKVANSRNTFQETDLNNSQEDDISTYFNTCID